MPGQNTTLTRSLCGAPPPPSSFPSPAGKLSDTRQRFLGTRAPRLTAVWVRGVRSLLALSSRPWLGYSDMGRWQFMPLSYEPLDHAAVRGEAQHHDGS